MNTYFLFLLIPQLFQNAVAKNVFEGAMCWLNGSKVDCPTVLKELKSGKNARIIDTQNRCWKKTAELEWRFTWCPRETGKKDYPLTDQENLALLTEVCATNGFLEQRIQLNQEPGAVTKVDITVEDCNLEKVKWCVVHDRSDVNYCPSDLLQLGLDQCPAEIERLKKSCAVNEEKGLKVIKDILQAKPTGSL